MAKPLIIDGQALYAAIKSQFNAPYASEWQWGSEQDLLPGTKRDWKRDAGELWRNSAVAVCLAWWQSVFPEPKLRVVLPGEDGGDEIVTGHAMPALIARPNPRYAGFHLWQATVLSHRTDGNAYWRKIRSSAGKVVELWYLPHWTVTPISKGTDFLTCYEYRKKGSAVPDEIKPEDMVHFRYGIDPEDQRKGLAPMRQGLRSVVSDNEADTYTAAILQNMGVPSVMLQPVDPAVKVDRALADTIKRIWKRMTGGDNRGEPLVPTFPLKIDQLMLNPQELALGTIRQTPEARICALMQVPAMITGLSVGDQQRTYSNWDAAMRSFMNFSIKPAQTQMAGELDLQLLPDMSESDEERTDWDYTGVSALSPEKTQERKDAALLYQAGVVTRAQALRMIELPAGDEDEVYFGQGQGGDGPEPTMKWAFGGAAKAASGHAGHVGSKGPHRGHVGKGGSANGSVANSGEDAREIELSDGSKRKVDVTAHGDTKIMVPTDVDAKAQTFTADDVKAMLDQIPAEHRGVVREVRVLDTHLVEDGKVWKETAGSYDPKTGVIEIYRTDGRNQDQVRTLVSGVVRHEAAHALADTLPAGFLRDWRKAAKKDGAFVTDYAKTNIHEDIAETVMHHWSPDRMDRRVVQTFFTERAAVLQRYGVAAGA